MATITTTIGKRSNENVNISSVSGASSPYTVTLSAAPSNTNIGDTLSDEAASPNIYLITGISGADLTVADLLGAGAAPSAAGSSQAFTSRTYSTFQAADDDNSNTNLYAVSGDVAIHHVYPDADFADETGTVVATSRADSTTYTVPTAERHNGTANTGPRRTLTANETVDAYDIRLLNDGIRVDSLEWDGQDFSIEHAIWYATNNNGTNNSLSRCLVHDYSSSATHDITGIACVVSDRPSKVVNNIVYNILHTGSNAESAYGIESGASTRFCHISNNSVYNVINNNGTGNAYGMALGSPDASANMYNNVSIGTGGTSTGTKKDYDDISASGALVGTNISSDGSTTTLGGTTEDPTTSAVFVSTTGGSEDLHTVSGSDLVGNGTDLGTNASGFYELDIDNYDRDAAAVTWDLGADQFVDDNSSSSSSQTLSTSSSSQSGDNSSSSSASSSSVSSLSSSSTSSQSSHSSSSQSSLSSQSSSSTSSLSSQSSSSTSSVSSHSSSSVSSQSSSSTSSASSQSSSSLSSQSSQSSSSVSSLSSQSSSSTSSLSSQSTSSSQSVETSSQSSSSSSSVSSSSQSSSSQSSQSSLSSSSASSASSASSSSSVSSSSVSSASSRSSSSVSSQSSVSSASSSSSVSSSSESSLSSASSSSSSSSSLSSSSQSTSSSQTVETSSFSSSSSSTENVVLFPAGATAVIPVS